MKIYDEKTKRCHVVFKEYELNGATACPECRRPFKDYDIKRLEENGYTRCPKCGAKLKK
jgi:predicted nucleic acid-binding Zn ribbon protein